MNSVSVTASSNHPAWKDSTNFAQKLKEQLAAPLAVVPTIEQQVTIRKRTTIFQIIVVNLLTVIFVLDLDNT